MGRLEQEERNRRAKEIERRIKKCVYTQLPQQTWIVHAVKAPLVSNVQLLINGSPADKIRAAIGLKQVIKNLRKLPRPTVENTWHPNSHKLIEVRNRLSNRYRQGDNSIFNLGADFLIIMYDYDPPYRDMIDDVFAHMKSSDWSINSLRNTRDWFMSNCGLSRDRLNLIEYGFNLVINHVLIRKLAEIAFNELRNCQWIPKGELDIIGHDWAFWRV